MSRSCALDFPEVPVSPRERASARSLTTVQLPSGVAAAAAGAALAVFFGDVAATAGADLAVFFGDAAATAGADLAVFFGDAAAARRLRRSSAVARDSLAALASRRARLFHRSALASARSSFARSFLTFALSSFFVALDRFFAGTRDLLRGKTHDAVHEGPAQHSAGFVLRTHHPAAPPSRAAIPSRTTSRPTSNSCP